MYARTRYAGCSSLPVLDKARNAASCFTSDGRVSGDRACLTVAVGLGRRDANIPAGSVGSSSGEPAPKAD